MTELERYENCRKERELITDFLSFVLRKYSCYLGNNSGNLNITAALDEYFGSYEKTRLDVFGFIAVLPSLFEK